MKRFLSILLASVGIFGALAFSASYAEAQHRGGGGGYRGGHGHHGHGHYGHGRYYGRGYGYGAVYFGAGVLAAPLLYPRAYGYYPYYGPYGYWGPNYYPAVAEQPVVYTEQAQAVAPAAPPPTAAPQAQQQYWYFCQDTQTYYPHAQSCATPWQRVIPHAPR